MARKRGNKWQADVVLPDGRRVRPSFDTEHEALAFEANPQAQTLKPVLGVVFRHGFDLFWKHQKNSKNSYRITEELITLLGGPDTRLNQVTTAAVQDLEITLRKKGNTDATINRKMAALSKLMKHAKERGCLLELPKVTTCRQEGEGRLRYLDHSEIDRIFTFLSPAHRAFAEFLLYTGCRVGESLALRWQDVKPDRITLRWSTTKGAKTRTLPLVGAAVDALTCGRERNWSAPWSGIHYDAFHEGFNRAKHRAGLGDDPEVVPHTLRHTCASWMVQDGVDIYRVQKWLGHSTVTTTMRYAHLAPSDLDAAGETLTKRHTVVRPTALPEQGTGIGVLYRIADPEYQSDQCFTLSGECPERQRGRTVNPGKDQGL